MYGAPEVLSFSARLLGTRERDAGNKYVYPEDIWFPSDKNLPTPGNKSRLSTLRFKFFPIWKAYNTQLSTYSQAAFKLSEIETNIHSDNRKHLVTNQVGNAETDFVRVIKYKYKFNILIKIKLYEIFRKLFKIKVIKNV